MSDEEEETSSLEDLSVSEDEWRPSKTTRGRRNIDGESSDDDDSDFEGSSPAGASTKLKKKRDTKKSIAGAFSSSAALSQSKKRKSSVPSLRSKLYNKYKPPPKTVSRNTPTAAKSRSAAASSSSLRNPAAAVSDSDSSVDDYLVDPNELDLRSSFFDVQAPSTTTTTATVEDSQASAPPQFDCNAGMNLSDSDDDIDDDDDDEDDDEAESSTSKTFDFKNLLDNATNLEQAKENYAKRNAAAAVDEKKKTLGRDNLMDVQSLLAIGEANSETSAPVVARKQTKQTKSARQKNSKSKTAVESDDSDWEEVADKSHVDDQHSKLNSTATSSATGDLQICVELPKKNQRKDRAQLDLEAELRRQLNRDIRAHQVLLHKTSLLVCFGRSMFYNKLANDPVLMRSAIKMLPSQNAYPPDRTEIKYFVSLVTWFKTAVTLKSDQMYASREPETRQKVHLSMLLQLEQRQALSKQNFVLMFVLLVRAMGLQCRLVVNLLPLPLRPAQNDLCLLKSSEEKKVVDKKSKSAKDCAKSSTKQTQNNEKCNAPNANAKRSKESLQSKSNLQSKSKTRKVTTSGDVEKPKGKSSPVELHDKGSMKSKAQNKPNQESSNMTFQHQPLQQAKQEEPSSSFLKPAEKLREKQNKLNQESSNMTFQHQPSQQAKQEEPSSSFLKTAEKLREKPNKLNQESNNITFQHQQSQQNKPEEPSSSFLKPVAKLRVKQQLFEKQKNTKHDSKLSTQLQTDPKKIKENQKNETVPVLRSEKRMHQQQKKPSKISRSFEETLFALSTSPQKPLGDLVDQSNKATASKRAVSRSSDSENLISLPWKMAKVTATDDDSKSLISLSVGKPKTSIAIKLKAAAASGTPIARRTRLQSADKMKIENETHTKPSQKPNIRVGPIIPEIVIQQENTAAAVNSSSKSLKHNTAHKEKSSPNSNAQANLSPGIRDRSRSKSPSSKVHISPKFLQNKINTKSALVGGGRNLRSRSKDGHKPQSHLTIPQIDGADDCEVSNSKSRQRSSRRQTNAENSDEDFEPSPPKKVKVAPLKAVELLKRDRRVLSTDDDDGGGGGSEQNNKKKSYVDMWVEVWSDQEEQWVCIDLFKGKVHCVDIIRKSANNSSNIAYVYAFQNDSTIKDISARYCPNWCTTARKGRVDQAWLDEALSSHYNSNKRTHRDILEDQELRKIHEEKPMPKTISEYKDHKLYALERHLLKFQAIYPPNAPTLGFIRSEPVYARECVHTLHSREIWLKQARVVKLGEQPYKIVKARPKWDRLTNTVIKDQPLEIFGYWQTQEYEPPTAENGIVPRNAYGNVELFKECMLPKKTAHLQLSGLNRVCKKLGVDCAPAVVGFDFHSGACHPTFDGFVVCEEFVGQVVAAWHEDQEEAERKEQEKYEARVYGNWKKLIRGLLIRERLKKKYNF